MAIHPLYRSGVRNRVWRALRRLFQLCLVAVTGLFEPPELPEPPESFELAPHDPPDFLWIEIESPAPTLKRLPTAG